MGKIISGRNTLSVPQEVTGGGFGPFYIAFAVLAVTFTVLATLYPADFGFTEKLEELRPTVE